MTTRFLPQLILPLQGIPTDDQANTLLLTLPGPTRTGSEVALFPYLPFPGPHFLQGFWYSLNSSKLQAFTWKISKCEQFICFSNISPGRRGEWQARAFSHLVSGRVEGGIKLQHFYLTTSPWQFYFSFPLFSSPKEYIPIFPQILITIPASKDPSLKQTSCYEKYFSWP